MSDMALGMTERLKPIHERVARMVRDEIMPLDEEFLAEVGKERRPLGHTRHARSRSSKG